MKDALPLPDKAIDFRLYLRTIRPVVSIHHRLFSGSRKPMRYFRETTGILRGAIEINEQAGDLRRIGNSAKSLRYKVRQFKRSGIVTAMTSE